MTELGVDVWKLIVQIIAFLLFVVLLWRLALGPIVAMLDARSDKIRESVAAAETMQQELRQTAARNEETLVIARQEAQLVLTNARDAADGVLARAREEAGRQSEEYLARAESTLRAETESARLQLREEIANLAVSAATKIVRRELDPADQARLIEETLAEAGAGSGAARPSNGRSSGRPA